jgi:GNAT superfamily N-acetyltransferase
MAVVQREAVVTGYAGMFPPEAPKPTVEQLRREWERALVEDGAMALVAEIGRDVVGTVHVRADPDFAGCGQLRRLNVVPSRWGEGIGGRLHDEALQLLTEAGFAVGGLWVLEDNGRARAMYERRGWSLVPGTTLEWPDLGVVEVRYDRALRTTT